MGIRTLLGLRESAKLVDERTALGNQIEVLREGLAELELAMEDRGWESLLTNAKEEFSRQGLLRASQAARTMAIANPLIKRGLAIRKSYIWGGGVEISCRADGSEGTQDVNAVIQAYLDDEGNQASFTGDQANEQNETALGTDGNVLFANFTSPLTGWVHTRVVPFDQITDIICNPEDVTEPWFYVRRWTETDLDGRTKDMAQAYPDLRYTPKLKRRQLDGGILVRWDAPAYHVKVNGQHGWKYGVGDAYAALAWARSYREFLADWATLVKALSQFAWKLTSPTKSAADKLRQKVARALPGKPGQPPTGNPGSVGATGIMTPDMNLEAIPKSGATIDSDSGQPLAAMVAAGLGVPLTMLLADPGTTGARAVAETLDTPTENEMRGRQSVWAQCRRAILTYVVKQAVRAPQGPLKGTITRDPYTDREVVEVSGPEDWTIDIDWPELRKLDPAVVVKAIVDADGTGKLPPLVTVKLLLKALGVEDIDEIMKKVTDDDGEWIDPMETVGNAVADAALQAYRRGADPAARVAGNPEPTPTGAPPEDS